MTNLNDTQKIAILVLIVLASSIIIGGLLLPYRYTPEENFLHYRLTKNLSSGHGLVYNPGDKTLVTLSPLFPVLLAGVPAQVDTAARLIGTISYTLVVIPLYWLLHRKDIMYTDIIGVVVVWMLAYPTWVAFGSPHGLAGLLIIWALNQIEMHSFRLAGLIAGFSILIQPESGIAVTLLGVYSLTKSHSWRYWQTAWLAVTGWIIFAAVTYTDIALSSVAKPVLWRDALWFISFVISWIVLARTSILPVCRIFPTWGASELAIQTITSGQIIPFASLPATLSIALALVITLRHSSRRWHIPTALMIWTSMFLLTISTLPRNASIIRDDIELASTMSLLSDISIAHDRSEALTSSFDGIIYHLDGRYSPSASQLLSHNDFQSMLVMLAPDYLYLTPNGRFADFDFDGGNLEALNYVRILDDAPFTIWHRKSVVGSFDNIQPRFIEFRPDVHITGFATDKSRVSPGDVVRVRLNWQLDYPPEDAVGLNLSLVDIEGQAAGQVIAMFPKENWQPLDIGTYHALRISDTASPGVYQLVVAVEYIAGLLGEHSVGELVIPPAPMAIDTTEPVGTLGSVVLHRARLVQSNGGLHIELTWETQESLDTDYSIFVHFTPLDSPVPIAQADGPPMNGRYPTHVWLPGDIIHDTRTLSLDSIEPGNYLVNVGLYDTANNRLRNESQDFIEIANVIVQSDGGVIIHATP